MDPVTAIGLIASIGTLLDYGGKLVARLVEYQGSTSAVTQAFKGLEINLPLILDALKRISNQTKDGKVGDETRKALVPVILSCHALVKALNEIMTKIVPLATDSMLERGVKAAQSIRKEREIDRLVKQLTDHLSTLIFHSTACSGLSQAPRKSIQSVFSVPFERDPDYVDRSDIMQEIERLLQSSSRAVLAGLGGVGKSQIAIEYCYRFQEKHPDAHIFWHHVSSIERARSSWFDMAQKLSIQGFEDAGADHFHLVNNYLSNDENRPWLLLLDNADDADVFFRPPAKVRPQGHQPPRNLASCLPRSKRGSILITTRDKRAGERLTGSKQIVTVNPFSKDEACQLLKTRLPADEWDDDKATELVHELEYLPLAITQAAAYMAQNVSSISDYLIGFRVSESERKELLNEDFYDMRRDQDIQAPLSHTWRLSFGLIQKQKPRAIELLSVMAVLDRESIPRSLLLRDGESGVSFTAALGVLQGFSLIELDKKRSSFRMHRLVQLSTTTWLDQHGKLEECRLEALGLLAVTYSDHWEDCQFLEPHIYAFKDFKPPTAESELQFSKLLFSLAVYQRESGRYLESYSCLTRANEVKLASHGNTIDTHFVDIWIELGLTEERMGKHGEAEQSFTRAWKTFGDALGQKHPKTLQSLNYIGGSLWMQGRYDAAKQKQETCWHLQREFLGDEHPDTLKTLSDIAACHEALADHAIAEKIYREILTTRSRTLGDSHVHTVESMSRLGSALDKNGKHGEAEAVHRETWMSRKKLLGPHHGKTVESLKYVAGSLWYQGKYTDAEKIHREVLKIRIYTLKDTHPDTLTSMKDLAVILDAQGESHKAEKLHRNVLEARKIVLGEDHPETLQSMSDLAHVMRCQNKLDECAKLIFEVYNVRSRTLGLQHPQTLESMDRIAGILIAQQKAAAAIDMQHKVLTARKIALGPDHPEALASMDSVVGTLWGEQRLVEATELLREALALREARYGADDHETLIRLTRLAYLIRIQGQVDEAIVLYQKASELYERTLGPDDPNTQGSVESITAILADKAALINLEVPDAKAPQ